MNGLIDALRADNEALKSVLTATEPSLVVSTEATMAKVLLLASASHLEQMTQEILLSFFSEITAGTPAAELETKPLPGSTTHYSSGTRAT